MIADLTARVLAILGLLVLVVGSAYVLLEMLGMGADPSFPGDYVAVGSFMFFVLWPLVLLVSGLLIATGLLRLHGRTAALLYLLGTLVAYVVVLRVLTAMARIEGGNTPWGRLSLTAMLGIVLFLGVILGATYVSWRFVLQG